MLSKLRLSKVNSKNKDREVGVLYPRFLYAIMHKELSKTNNYPEGDLHYSEIGFNILIQRAFPNEVRLRQSLVLLSWTALPMNPQVCFLT